MKKKFLFLFSVAVFALLCSCNKDVNDLHPPQPSAESFTAEQAKAWYNAHYGAGSNAAVQKARAEYPDSVLMTLKPLLDWDAAEFDNDSLWEVVELPWEYENGEIIIASTEVKEQAEQSSIEMRQVLRIVIIKNRQTGDIYGFKMAVLPD